MTDALPADVQAFICKHIDSVEAVNVLLLIFEQPAREWTADEVARELRTNEWSADLYLRVLRTRDLLHASHGSPARFRAEPAFAGAVAALGQAYRERRVAVIRFIYGRPGGGA